jgi:hypothetical protein
MQKLRARKFHGVPPLTTSKLSQFPYLKKAGGGVSIEKVAAVADISP